MNLSREELSISFRGQTKKIPSQVEKDALRAKIAADVEEFVKNNTGVIDRYGPTRAKIDMYKEYQRNSYQIMKERKGEV